MNQAEFDKISEELDEIAAQEKPIEQFRQEIVGSIYLAIRKETASANLFMEKADYLNVKLCETKIAGLHKALSILLEASTVEVKEGE